MTAAPDTTAPDTSWPDPAALLRAFAPLDMDRRWQMLRNLDRIGHATARAPRPGCTWDAQTYAIEACGITAEDVDRDTAIEIWMRAAARATTA